LETELYLLRTNSDNILQNSSKLPSTSSSLAVNTSPGNLTSLFLDKSNRIATSNYHPIANNIPHGSQVNIGGKHKLVSSRSDSPETPAKKTKMLSAETAALLSKNQVNRPQTSLSEFFDQEQENKVELKQANEEQAMVSPSSLGSNTTLRPYKCDECNISFRTSGHLARHKRSKSHTDRWKPEVDVENSNPTETISATDDAENRPYELVEKVDFL
jgi:hypothetical protein